MWVFQSLLFMAIGLCSTALAQTFTHPGVIHSLADLNRMKTKVAASAEPWITGYKSMAADSHSSSSYNMRGPFASITRNPSVNLSQWEDDCGAAYQNALMWYITGNAAHATKAIQILNAWSSTCTSIGGADARLTAGLQGHKFITAAEIIRHTGAGWSTTGITNCSNFIRNVLVPLNRMYGGGNWGIAGAISAMAAGVFLDDQALFDEAVNSLKYGASSECDIGIGAYIDPAGWTSEADRDIGHWGLGINNLSTGAHIAWCQGVDLWTFLNRRMHVAHEYLANYNLGGTVSYSGSGTSQCDGFVNGGLCPRTGTWGPMWEQVWNPYQNMLGIPAPFSKQVADSNRPEGYDRDHASFGTLLFFLDTLPAGLPVVPTGLSAAWSNARVSLAWTASAGVTSYNVKRATSRGGPYTNIATGVTATSYTDNTAANNTLYCYRVSAVNVTGETFNSGLVSAYPSNAVPAATVGVDASAITKSRIDILWDATLGATSYTVKRATSSGGPYTTIATGLTSPFLSYANTGLSVGTTYHYTVSAVNSIGEGANSAQSSATTLAALQSPWEFADAGYVTTPGNATYSGSTFTVKGAGLDIGSSFDTFGFAYVSLTGDGTLTARMASRKQYSGIGKAGIMMRGSLAGGSTQVSARPGSFSYRGSTGGGTTGVAGAAGNWMRITRVGNTFTAYGSEDGATWNLAGSTTIAMAQTIYVGFTVCSRNNGVLDTATFDNVTTAGGIGNPPVINSPATATGMVGTPFSYTITATNSPTGFGATNLPAGLGVNASTGVISGTPTATGTPAVELSASNTFGTDSGPLGLTINPSGLGALPAEWSTSDIGSVSTVGSAGYNSATNTFTVAGSGGDIGGTGDTFRFVYQNMSDDGSIIARLATEQIGGTANDKVGIMLRESTANNARFVAVVLDSGSATARFGGRSATGGTVTWQNGPTGISAPRWFRLAREGNSFTGYVSTTGSTWTQIGTAITVTMTSTIQIGMAVCSRDPALNTSTFDNVTAPGTAITVSIVATTPAAESGSTAGVFTVSRTGSTALPLTVQLALAGTATNATDYAPLDSTCVIPAGKSSETISVSPLADTLAEGSETVTVTLAADPAYAMSSLASASVTIADKPVDEWRVLHFAAQANTPSVAGDLADPDGDGLSNMVEYAVGGNPARSASAPQPVVQLVEQASQRYLSITFQRIADPSLSYKVEVSNTLVEDSWSTIWSSTGAANVAGPVTVIDTEPLTANPRRFLRLRVSEPTTGSVLNHPGGYQTQAAMTLTRSKVAANQAPWSTAWAAIANTSNGYKTSVSGVVTDAYKFQNDGHAAYVNAIKWVASGNITHANTARAILDQWVDNVTDMSALDPLRTGIGGNQMANAAEILAHAFNGSAGWPASQVSKAKAWFKAVAYPPISGTVRQRSSNWGTSALSGCMAMAIFCDDQTMLDYAVSAYKNGFPGADGCCGVAQYIPEASGQCAEAGRDQGHAQGGVGHLMETAFMASHQGIDLVTYADNRVAVSLEYLAKYGLGNTVPYNPNFADPCGVHPIWPVISPAGRGSFSPIWEMANRFFTDVGIAHPFVAEVLTLPGIRPETTNGDHPGMGTLLYTPEPAS